MGNHFHLVVETPRGNLVAGMKWLLGVYTSRFNRRHKLFGHLFSGRYKALIVDGSGNGYFKTACDYVHLNPSRARLLDSDQSLKEYMWSSWPEYLKRPGKRSVWVRTDRLLGEYRIGRDTVDGRRFLEECMEERRAGEDGTEYKGLRRGWFFGDKTLSRTLLKRLQGGFTMHHDGEERWVSAEEHAEELLGGELKRLGWQEADLERRRKSDPEKLRIARRLRTESTMTLKWIGERLQLKT
jgi:hypothetical protein